MYALKIGPESPHRRHSTTNLPKTHQVHTCIQRHMRPAPKSHNLVPLWPFYKPFFLFESPFCVEYIDVFDFDSYLTGFETICNVSF